MEKKNSATIFCYLLTDLNKQRKVTDWAFSPQVIQTLLSAKLYCFINTL